MTDRYANGDPANDTGGHTGTRNLTGFDPTSPAWWHGGDLRGLTGGCTDPVHGLERIKDLGFNAIWITPVVVNQISQGDSGGYHGYWGMDFTTVDPHLGTEQDLADFVVLRAQPRDEGDPRRRRQPHRRHRPVRGRLDVLAACRTATATARSSSQRRTSARARSRA